MKMSLTVEQATRAFVMFLYKQLQQRGWLYFAVTDDRIFVQEDSHFLSINVADEEEIDTAAYLLADAIITKRMHVLHSGTPLNDATPWARVEHPLNGLAVTGYFHIEFNTGRQFVQFSIIGKDWTI